MKKQVTSFWQTILANAAVLWEQLQVPETFTAALMDPIELCSMYYANNYKGFWSFDILGVMWLNSTNYQNLETIPLYNAVLFILFIMFYEESFDYL